MQRSSGFGTARRDLGTNGNHCHGGSDGADRLLVRVGGLITSPPEHVRDYSDDELYKLVLHSAVLAIGLADALLFATLARRLAVR
jgi:hypothetical protein